MFALELLKLGDLRLKLAGFPFAELSKARRHSLSPG